MGHGPNFALQTVHRAVPRGSKLFACESRGADQGDGAHNSGQLGSLDGWIHLGRWSNQNGLYVHNSFFIRIASRDFNHNALELLIKCSACIRPRRAGRVGARLFDRRSLDSELHR